MSKLLLSASIISALFFITTSHAALSNELKAHVHGQAQLMLAVEHDKIDFKLISPAESLLGFEHQPTTLLEFKKIADVKQLLEVHSNIFQFNGSDCQIQALNIDTSQIMNNGRHQHAHAHKDIIVNYQLKCHRSIEATSVTLKLFKHFPTLKNINAMWITPSNQGAEQLNTKNTTLMLY
ncbi:DUF2796 domain-containing protein [Psychrobium sp. 1_MG-2023]|uniref:ZrgA family zinc uptake protein n=1 Tax=Psychrobium sp. 1_MG-2023 TaxID=3062624 RepID=UPI000C3410DA|nr:DUF2796 domain-containing protein [Psychrobium sp. 1_MG-2023]MDP2561182.1 DUF2796 domain-containing protein [Psychrobium sp. 1_MG-2023]PKF55153.1 hypothetical protein CW748_14430 [Alteromonadales bacterium alter-6D02]